MAGAVLCIWSTFSSSVMRETMSAARCSGESEGFLKGASELDWQSVAAPLSIRRVTTAVMILDTNPPVRERWRQSATERCRRDGRPAGKECKRFEGPASNVKGGSEVRHVTVALRDESAYTAPGRFA